MPLAFETLELRQLLASDLVISEFLASNSAGLLDEDGDSSDWIEIHNPTAATVSLNNWYLTDRSDFLSQWKFPNVSIAPGGFLVVFASTKDRAIAGSELHTSFAIDSAGEYLALVHPDGVTIAHEYAPFPSQDTDVSYGLPFDGAQLVSEGDLAETLVPTTADGALGTTWTQVGFSAGGSWIDGPTGVVADEQPTVDGLDVGVREVGDAER